MSELSLVWCLYSGFLSNPTTAFGCRKKGTGPALGSVDGKKRNGVSHLTAGRQPPPTWKGAPRYNEQQLSPNQREQEEDQPARRGVQRWRVDQPTAPTVASAGLFGKEDRAETARLCDELLRWSSALEGAEKQVGSKNGIGVGKQSCGVGRRMQNTMEALTKDTLSEFCFGGMVTLGLGKQ